MPKHPSAVTGTAGEHLVAARLAAMGFVVALTRGGSPSADLLVTNQSGTRTVAIQVKTAVWAGHWQKKDPSRNHWEWPIGSLAAGLRDERLLYAFVDLADWPDGKFQPQVFIVPSAVVALWVKRGIEEKWSRLFYWIYEKDKATYHEKWNTIADLLKNEKPAPTP